MLWDLLEHPETRTLPQLISGLSGGARRTFTISRCRPEQLRKVWLNKLIAMCFWTGAGGV